MVFYLAGAILGSKRGGTGASPVWPNIAGETARYDPDVASKVTLNGTRVTSMAPFIGTMGALTNTGALGPVLEAKVNGRKMLKLDGASRLFSQNATVLNLFSGTKTVRAVTMAIYFGSTMPSKEVPLIANHNAANDASPWAALLDAGHNPGMPQLEVKGPNGEDYVGYGYAQTPPPTSAVTMATFMVDATGKERLFLDNREIPAEGASTIITGTSGYRDTVSLGALTRGTTLMFGDEVWIGPVFIFNGKNLTAAEIKSLVDAKNSYYTTAQVVVPPPPASGSVNLGGTGTHVLVIAIAQDAYLGSAQYTISVDGTQRGGTQTAVALHSSTARDLVSLNLTDGQHSIVVDFLNDAYGGSGSTDRNLYVEYATYDGTQIISSSQFIGSGNFTFSAGVAAADPSGPVVVVPSSSADLVGPGGGSTGVMEMVIVGQSNALFYFEGDGYFGAAETERFVRGAGGGTTFAVRGERFDGSKSTIHSGTYSYNFARGADLCWFDASGKNQSDPNTWSNTGQANGCHAFLTERGALFPGRPIGIFLMHTEYDTQAFGSAERAVYEPFLRMRIARMRAAAGRTAAMSPVFFGPVPYVYANGTNCDTIRKVMDKLCSEAGMNCYYAYSNALDTTTRDDGSHWSRDAIGRTAGRSGLRFARWRYDNGWSGSYDGSWLPTLGPRYISLKRVPGVSNAYDLGVGHDKGNDIVMTSNPVLGDYDLSRDWSGIATTRLERINAQTVRGFTSGNIPAGGILRFQYGVYFGQHGPDRMVKDNWQNVAKPASASTIAGINDVAMIMCSTRTPIQET